MQLANELLAAAVSRMGLAGKHDLKAAASRDGSEALEIAEQQIGALVGGHAAGESEDRNVRVERHAGFCARRFDELGLAACVRFDYRLVGQAAVGAHE